MMIEYRKTGNKRLLVNSEYNIEKENLNVYSLGDIILVEIRAQEKPMGGTREKNMFETTAIEHAVSLE